MSDFIKKAKEFFDWMEHVRLVVDVLVGLGAGTVARGLLVVLTHLNPVWITPLWLFVAAAVSFGMTKLRHGKKPEQPGVLVQNATSSIVAPPSPPVNFYAAAFFRLSYVSPLTDDAERRIKVAAEQNQPNDREGFYARLIGIGLIAYAHDMTWETIYKSQLLMLLELNKRGGLISINDAKPFYDQAVIAFPDVYKSYSYDQWLGYLKGKSLILQHPSGMLEITLMGKDLLKYLIHWGRYPDARRG